MLEVADATHWRAGHRRGTVNACDGTLTLDWNTFRATHPASLRSPTAGGEQVWAQGWKRDPPASKTTDLSNTIEFLVCP